MRIALGALALVLGCALAGAAWANPIAPGMPQRPIPSPPPPQAVPPINLRIVPATQDRQTRLRLPAKLLAGQKASAPSVGHRTIPPGNTLVAALALSLGVVLGGLWLARRAAPRRVAGWACAALAVLVVVNLSGCPPLGPEWEERFSGEIPPLAPREDGALKGLVLLEASGTEEGMRLVVDGDPFSKFLDAATPRPVLAPPLPPRLPSHAVGFVIEPGAGMEAKLVAPRALLTRAHQVAQGDLRKGPRAPLFAWAALLGCGGLVLATRRVRGLLLALLLSGAVFTSHDKARANAPFEPTRYLKGLTPAGAQLEGMRVEIAEEGEAIRLILPRAKFADLARTFPAR